MRVLYLQQQPCIRALKLAVGLRAARPDVELAFAYQGRTLSQFYGSGDELFAAWLPLGDDPSRTLSGVLDEFRPDLVHSHNLPDSLTVLAQEAVRGRIAVVHDVHDLESLRRTPYENGFPQPRNARALERRAIEGSTALVTVSDELLAEVRRRYRIAGPTLVLPNYALERDLPDLRGRRANADVYRDPLRPRLVYEGTLSTNGGHYDLRAIFGALVEDGATLDVYPSRDEPAYRELAARTPGLTYHDSLSPSALLGRLSSYDFGWAGFDDRLNRAHLDTALPNKLFEYLACGLPVLTLRHRALARFVRERGVGVVLRSPAHLVRELAAHDAACLRRRVAELRSELTVEANAPRLAKLYESLVAVAA